MMGTITWEADTLTLPGVGFRRPERKPPPLSSVSCRSPGRRLPGRYRSAAAAQFAPAQAAEGGQEDEGAVPLVDRVGERVDLRRWSATAARVTSSCPAPLIRHGLRRISPSSAAVFMIGLSSRYALAAVTALTRRRGASCASAALSGLDVGDGQGAEDRGQVLARR